MDLSFSPSQQLLQQSARALLQQRCPIERVQAIALDPRGFAADLWKEIAMLGWPGLLVPPGLGGSGGSLGDALALVEELGRACFPSPFIGSAIVATTALTAAGGRRAQALLPALALGERICALAVLEESGRLDPGALALPVASPGRLTGRKLFVPDAHVATDVIVLGRSAAGPTALLLPMDRAGITTRPLDSMTGDKLFELELTDVDVGPDDLLGTPGGGWALMGPAFRAGALARCAEMVGAAQRVLELCVEHARVRAQGGRPIGGYQAIQHACADLFRDVESARWLTWHAEWGVAAGRADADTAVAAAKTYCGEAALRVARRGHQIMGAIGYSEEHPLHLFHKRILAAGLDAGDATLHLETVAKSIGLP
ncbi:MAG TPA: acyl-CoA dehydrogenase family protein [Methylomirabilota bacterium]|nr:acyl-CoA dehydrogenase family protein [Methylomirabilota bacterium]